MANVEYGNGRGPGEEVGVHLPSQRIMLINIQTILQKCREDQKEGRFSRALPNRDGWTDVEHRTRANTSRNGVFSKCWYTSIHVTCNIT
jgi:hypothetical protein